MDNELNTLQHLFKHIPALSSPSGQAILPFSIDYELDPEKVEYFKGLESDALNQVLEVCFSDCTRYNVTLENGKTEYYNDIKLPDHNPAALMALVGIMEKYFVGNKVGLEIWDGLTHLLIQ